MNELKSKVIAAFIARETGKESQMTDREYDKALAKIESADPTFNIYDFLPLEEGVEEAEHTIEIAELDKSYVDANELDEVINGEIVTDEEGNETRKVNDSIIVMPKYDGSSLVAYYSNGVLSHILTRGDSNVGKVKTDTLKQLFPNKVNEMIRAIRAELVVDTRASKNARAKANGLVNSKGNVEEINRLATVIAFSVIDIDGNEMDLNAPEVCQLGTINFDGITTPKFFVTGTMNDYTIVDKGQIKHNTYDLQIPFDGVVCIEFNEELQESYKYAYKYDFIDSVETTITGIEVEATSKEAYSHVILVNPVVIDDKELSRIYVGGAGVILDEGYYIGQKVMVAFRGATIPTIVEKVTELPMDEETGEWGKGPKGEEVSLGVCPDCGTPFTAEFVVRGLAKCPNPDCKAKIEKRTDTAYGYIESLGVDGYQVGENEEDIEKLPVVDGKYDYKAFFANSVANQEDLFLNLLNLPNFKWENKRQLPAEEYFDQMIEACKLGNFTEVVNHSNANQAEFDKAMKSYEELKATMEKLNARLDIEIFGEPTAMSLFESAFKASEMNLIDFSLRIKATFEVFSSVMNGTFEVAEVVPEVEEEEEAEPEMTEDEIRAEIERLTKKLSK